MSKHKFPTSTKGRYIPGVGFTITRANLEKGVYAAAIVPKKSVGPFNAEVTVALFNRECEIALARNRGRTVEDFPRHLARARKLFAPKATQETQK